MFMPMKYAKKVDHSGFTEEKNRKYVMIAFIAGFVIYAIVNSWIGYVDSKNTKKFVNELSYEYIQQQDRFKKLYDSATVERLRMSFQIVQMESELKGMREQDQLFNKIHEEKMKELEKKYKNEKDYIPDVPDNERDSYLSEYEYEVF